MICGEKIRLRELRAEDAAALLKWMSDPETARRASGGSTTPRTLTGMQDWVRKHRRDAFVAEPLEGGEPLGVCTYQGLDRAAHTCRVGFLVAGAAQGRGYGTEMALLLLRYLFRERDLLRVDLAVLAENAPARRLYEKLGFRRAALPQTPAFAERTDLCGYSMAREDYETKFGNASR